MTDTITRQANAEELAALQEGQNLASQARPLIFATPGSKTYVVGFDGTLNDQKNPAMGPITNVAVMSNQAQAAFDAAKDGSQARYYPGPGTTGLFKALDAGSGATMAYTARQATDDFQLWAQKQLEADPNTKVNLAGISFSRGAITHTIFLNNVYNEGVGKRGTELRNDPTDPTKVTGYREYWIAPKAMDMGAHLMYDRVAGPVNAAGEQGVLIPEASGLQLWHITASLDNRRDFTLQSVVNPNGTIDPRFMETSVAGAHSNIGGGYLNNGIAAYTLDMGMRWFASMGLNLGTVPEQYQPGFAPLNINNSFADYYNGARGLGSPDDPLWVTRAMNVKRYWQRTAATTAPQTQNGTEVNRVLVTTTTGDLARQDRLLDATATPNANNATLIEDANRAVNTNNNVNTATGNTAVANYIISDSVRPGNTNLGSNLNEATGADLNVTAPLSPEVLDNALRDFGLLGSDINSSAQGNFSLTPVDPLVLDLNGDGVRLTNFTDSPVLFDADNDGGSLEQTGWVSAADAILVHDLNADGKINNISETLSEYYNGVAGSNGNAGTKPFTNGFTALKSLDSNADNQFTAADAAWNQLRVWVDANHDGKTDAGELKTFAELGITAISLNAVTQSGEVRDGNEVLARGTFTQNGQTKEAIAVNFLSNPAGSVITTQAGGTTVTTEGINGGPAITAFLSSNANAGRGESLYSLAFSAQNSDCKTAKCRSNEAIGARAMQIDQAISQYSPISLPCNDQFRG